MYLFTSDFRSASETSQVTVFGDAINTCGKKWKNKTHQDKLQVLSGNLNKTFNVDKKKVMSPGKE